MPSERKPHPAESGDGENYGYSVFPKRSPGEDYKPGHRFVGFRAWRHNRCLKNVLDCALTDPFVRYLIVAIRSRGCHFTLSRNVSCERCRFGFSGGYDPVRRQVALCENEFWGKAGICSVMRHELLHAFDDCRAVLFKEAEAESADPAASLDRLACSEIRAASLNHCMLHAAQLEGYTGPLNYAGDHQHCVKSKALMSVLAARRISRPDAEVVIERVFDRCYADLEPLGRIPASVKTFRADCQNAIVDGARYGYSLEEARRRSPASASASAASSASSS